MDLLLAFSYYGCGAVGLHTFLIVRLSVHLFIIDVYGWCGAAGASGAAVLVVVVLTSWYSDSDMHSFVCLGLWLFVHACMCHTMMQILMLHRLVRYSAGVDAHDETRIVLALGRRGVRQHESVQRARESQVVRPEQTGSTL